MFHVEHFLEYKFYKDIKKTVDRGEYDSGVTAYRVLYDHITGNIRYVTDQISD